MRLEDYKSPWSERKLKTIEAGLVDLHAARRAGKPDTFVDKMYAATDLSAIPSLGVVHNDSTARSHFRMLQLYHDYYATAVMALSPEKRKVLGAVNVFVETPVTDEMFRGEVRHFLTQFLVEPKQQKLIVDRLLESFKSTVRDFLGEKQVRGA
jgi:hypothetical protein